ncbi:carboxypeptidase-like regulatory domain-containing protein, partial [Streptomyces sp. NPDC087850]|uniref:carboxypeptidase-like regulatory domain-containing protein n=1 Tax=Streptomyces sp. NPDC087850 TaxID=3365809 RepID=UPI00381F7EAC
MLDVYGAPVPRAKVTLIDRRGGQAGLATADEDGRYTLLPPGAGPYVLAGTASGY